MKKLSQLENMRSSIGDFSNISKEIVSLRKQLLVLKTKVAEVNTLLDPIKASIDTTNQVINSYYDKQKDDTQGERSSNETIQEEITVLGNQLNVF